MRQPFQDGARVCDPQQLRNVARVRMNPNRFRFQTFCGSQSCASDLTSVRRSVSTSFKISNFQIHHETVHCSTATPLDQAPASPSSDYSQCSEQFASRVRRPA